MKSTVDSLQIPVYFKQQTHKVVFIAIAIKERDSWHFISNLAHEFRLQKSN